MKRTNLLLEVSDEVYSQLVEPMKRAKSFTKLVQSLLNGYIRDPYIRSFVDNTLEESRRAAFESLNQAFAEMEDLVSKMGMTADEIGVAAEAGQQQFSQRRKDAAEELNSKDAGLRGNSTNAKEVNAESSKDYEDLSARVDGLERTINENFSALFKAIQNLGQDMPTRSDGQGSQSADPGEVTLKPAKAEPASYKQIRVATQESHGVGGSLKENAASAMMQAVSDLPERPRATQQENLAVGSDFLTGLLGDVGMQF